MAAKEKKAKKDKAKKTETSAPAQGVYSALDDADSVAREVEKSLKTLVERKKGREVDFSTQGDLLIDKLPLRSIYFQWMINNRGLPKGITNMVAKDKLGKTSFLYNLFGGFLLGGHPCAVIVFERKPLERLWAARCLSTDLKLVERMNKAIHVIKCNLLEEGAEMLAAWAKTRRDPKSSAYVPPHVSLVVAFDPLNKAATNAQAAGVTKYDGMDKEKPVDIADHGHMWDRAKWLHDWVARLMLLQREYNLHFVAIEHQNEDGVGGGAAKGFAFLPQYQKELGHRTKPGGQALNQVANLQLTFADKGGIYSAGEKVARRIIVQPYKNSYGNENRTCCFALKGTDFNDTDTFLDPGFRWDYTEVEWLAENGFLGFRKTGATLTQERFSSDVLGFTQLSLVEAAKAWREASPELVEGLGKELCIPGYINVYDRVIKQLEE